MLILHESLYNRSMELNTLSLFVEVVKQGSFAAVARDLDLDPSYVSRAIASLEAELGMRLFQRSTRQLSPTEAGLLYFEHIEPLVEEMHQARDKALDVSRQPKGILRVTASVSFGLKCIVPLLPKWNALYPDLTVDLALTDTVVDLLSERIDLAVRLGLLPDSSLVSQLLMPTHYVVCASPKYLQGADPLLNPQDLAQHPCLLFPLTGFRSRWIFKDIHGELTEVLVSGRTLISSAIALQQCAISGMGLALLPNWLIDEDLRNGSLINVFPTYAVTATNFNTAAWLVYPSHRYVPRKVRVFSDFLLQTTVPR